MIILAHLLASAAAVYAHGLNSRRYLALCAVMPGLVFYEVTMLWFPGSKLVQSGLDDERIVSVSLVLVAYAVLFTINLFRDLDRNQEYNPDLLKQVVKWGLGLPLVALAGTVALVWQRQVTIQEDSFLQWARPSASEHLGLVFFGAIYDSPGLFILLMLTMMTLWILSLDRIRKFYSGQPVGWMHSLFVIAGFLALFGIDIVGVPVWLGPACILALFLLPILTFLTTSKPRPISTGTMPMPLLLAGSCALGIYVYWFWQMLHHQQVVAQSVSVL